MIKQKQSKSNKKRQKRTQKSPWVLSGLIFLWSLAIGIGLAVALGTNSPVYSQSQAEIQNLKSLDPVPEELAFARDIYVERCGECHVALPTEILPTETWRFLLESLPQHYNVKTRDIISPEIILMWNYIQSFSRTYGETGEPPFRIADSRYFRAIHPKVEFQQTQTANTCTSCHDRATEFNYRSFKE
ncbi:MULTISPECIES: cytochrome C [Spirulina sp. CCY15215]|uniref:cytochrome C n=1 Tax=Spirulina sp. CCY15215 TaxID=2767591 RepID=UPI0019518E8A|nr:cytochrome C [Spirulina major]